MASQQFLRRHLALAERHVYGDHLVRLKTMAETWNPDWPLLTQQYWQWWVSRKLLSLTTATYTLHKEIGNVVNNPIVVLQSRQQETAERKKTITVLLSSQFWNNFLDLHGSWTAAMKPLGNYIETKGMYVTARAVGVGVILAANPPPLQFNTPSAPLISVFHTPLG